MKAILFSVGFAGSSLLWSYTALSDSVGWTLKGFLGLLILLPCKSWIYDPGDNKKIVNTKSPLSGIFHSWSLFIILSDV